LLISDTHCTNY